MAKGDQTPQAQPSQEGISDQTPQVQEASEITIPAQASDKTVPGGKYLVNGVYVDANGEPLK